MTSDRSAYSATRIPPPDGPAGPAQAAAAPPPSRVLIAATLRWPLAARMAMAFDALGCTVASWCPQGHPLEHTRAAGSVHRADVLRPQRSLRRAIRAAQPDLVIPCDDEAARLLAALYRRSAPEGRHADLHHLLRRSLGAPHAGEIASQRDALMARAALLGIRIPYSALLPSVQSLEHWLAEQRLPFVLKVDGSWGGQGIAIVHSPAQARAAYRQATHPSWIRALIELLLRRDPGPLLRRLGRRRVTVTAQQFIRGDAANRAVVSAAGETLAGASVVAVETASATGPATVVRAIDHIEMTDAATLLVQSLGLSGFSGLDFIIEAGSQAAFLIEMNPRATPICHLPLGPQGGNLPAALIAHLRDDPLLARVARGIGPGHDLVALFPGEWRRDPASHYLRSAFHDVPWQEAALVDECAALPWEDRGVIARLRARVTRTPSAALAVRPRSDPFRSPHSQALDKPPHAARQ